MKTIFIDCSPKRKLSASGFISRATQFFVSGNVSKEKLRTQGDYKRIIEKIDDVDSIVFAMPLYVDGVPSHILPFLKEVESKYKGLDAGKSVYVIANNGFIEGRQNEPLMQVMENFCDRAGLTWCGGLGIGGGVMMNVMRIAFLVVTIITAIQIILNGMNLSFLKDFGKFILEILILGCGIITYDIWIARCISKRKVYGKHYTRIMLPSFVFIIVADIFFTIISIFNGGIFRGWFSKKAPTSK